MLRRSRLFLASSSSTSGPFDPFYVLGVSPSTATRESVKQRYRELAKSYHPDSGTTADPEKMNTVNRAYNMLIKEGMIDQVRSSRQPTNVDGTVGPDGHMYYNRPQNMDDRYNNNNEGGGGVDDSFDDAAENDPDVVSKLDPGTERISEDGAHFLYLNRETNQWVKRRRPLTQPHQPRYGTFSQFKEENAAHPEEKVDLINDIRRRSLSMEVKEEKRTNSQRFTRHFNELIPFDNPYFIFVTCLVYLYTVFLLWHRIMDKKYLFDDKREFYFDRRTQREMVDEAFELFAPEVLLEAEAAMLVFAAAALKTKLEDPVVPPTPSEATVKTPYYFYHLMINCA